MSFHGYSEDEESPVLRDFVNEEIARQTQSPSPRSELLSPTSPPQRTLQSEISRPRRSRGPSERYRRQREQAYANVSSRQLLSLLIEKEYEANKLRMALHKTFDRFEGEARRVVEAERVTQQTLNEFRTVNEGKIAAERGLAKANEELRLWKFQFDHMQNELARAQDVVRLVERQRDDAEGAASKARATARQLNELRLVTDASEEGWRLGYQAGFRRAQEDLVLTNGTTSRDTYQDLELTGPYPPRRQPENGVGEVDHDLDASPAPAHRARHDLQMPQMPPSGDPPTTTDTLPGDPPTTTDTFPGDPPTTTDTLPSTSMPVPVTMPVPSPNPMPAPPSPSRRDFGFETEPAVRRSPPLRSPSPDISIYPIEIPSASVLNGPTNYHRPPPGNNIPASLHPGYAPQLAGEQQSYQHPPQPRPVPENININIAPPQRLSSSARFYHPAPPPPISENNTAPLQPQRRPPSQAASTRQRPRAASTSANAPPPPAPPPKSPQLPQYHLPPDNYIPSASENGDIALPPPFQLSAHLAMSPRVPVAPLSPRVAPVAPLHVEPRGGGGGGGGGGGERTQSWYNNNAEGQNQQQQAGQQPQSWYQQPKRGPRSNAGSATGSVRTAKTGSVRTAARSVSASVGGGGWSAQGQGQGRHARQASLDSRLSQAGVGRSQGQYGTDLGAIREVPADARSGRSVSVGGGGGRGYGGSQWTGVSGMGGMSEESLAPPPPARDTEAARYEKQIIADELRYSNPDLAEGWRQQAASAKADTASSRSRPPPRNVRLPAKLTVPALLSPPSGAVPLGQGQGGHMRARTMSGSTGRSGRTQPFSVDLGRPQEQPLPMDLGLGVGRVRSLRHVTPRRPVSPSEKGTPYFGTITIEPPSQSSSSQIPLAPSDSQLPSMGMGEYLSPNSDYRKPLPLPQSLPQGQTAQGQGVGQAGQPGTGFVPQSMTIPTQITVPVTFKGKAISSPISPGAPLPIPFPGEGGVGGDYRASTYSLNAEQERPLSRARSNSAMSRKSGKTEALPVNVGPTLTAGPTLTRQASNASLRSTASSAYARFDANAYVDPAYFAADHNSLPVPAPRSRNVSGSSRHSGLSYIGPPGPA
ncbi:hypothetical protein K438DRAFT_1925913 [Mycena galopus ATCC 62051]|nr:hypothetical protein K438DRAFT_1925913 [Mycena galopus ATCC 62051]